MLESKIASSDLTADEPILTKYGSDYSAFVTSGFNFLYDAIENRLPKKGADIRKLCTRLNLTLGDSGKEDVIGRRRLVYQLSAAESNSFELYGSNDDETYNLINTYTITTTTQTSAKLTDIYKYYKVVRKTGTTSFSLLYLVESSFELPHKLISLSFAFRSISRMSGDDFEVKANFYKELYEQALNNINYSLDSDEDGEIDVDEELSKTNVINYKL